MVDFDIWVQIHAVNGYVSKKVGKFLGNFIGSFLNYDSKNGSSLYRDYMHVKFCMDIQHPQKRFKKIRINVGDWRKDVFK